ncbi:MAG TPA: hypothetical protein VIN56_03920 [Candidatus Dormibacteraeota bacterium]
MRRARISLGAACLGMAAVSVTALMQPVLSLASSSAIAVDRQDYVSDAGPDAYQAFSSAEGTTGPDPVDIHVGAAPGQPSYHSFVHLELEAIPSGSTIQELTLKLVPTTNPQRSPGENVNTTQAVLDAFPLKTELPVKFDPNNPPAVDRTGGEAVGKVNDKDGSWTFDLTKLVPYWQKHGNTGAAIVPDPVASQPWTIGFDRTLSAATAGYAPTSSSSSGGSSAGGSSTGVTGTQQNTQTSSGGSGGSAPISQSGPGLGIGAPPASLATPPSATQPTPTANGGQVARPATGGASTATPPGTVPWWLLALVVSLTAAVALLAQPVSQALGSAGGLSAGLLGQLRLHPRMFAVSGMMVVWSSSLGVYANTLGKNTLGPTQGVVAGNNGANGGAGGANGATNPSGNPSAGPAGSSGTGTNGSSGQGSAAGGGSNGQPLTGAAAYANSPNAPHPPAADLFSPSENNVGITNTTVQMCAHAALTFGPAFNIGASDLNVFWQMVDDQGGVWGRKIVQPGGAPGIPFQDDGYQPSRAVTAAQACQDQTGGDFLLLGGIGFDQVPAVRVWAESHHMPYIHHIATQNGSAGLRYSYTMLPTLEQIGTQYGQYYVGHAPVGTKLGVIYRNSSNWDPGRATFNNYLKQAGRYGEVQKEIAVTNNQGDYSAEISQMQLAGVNEVFIYENALAAEQFIQQSHNQNWNPKWLMFPFNLTLNTLAQAGVDTSHMEGVIPWPAYTCNSSNDPRYSPYKADIQKFEAAYRRYDSGANLCGDGGDLLYGTWLAWEQVYDLLYQCGPSCSRNNIAGLMQNGYHATVGANCAVDFRGTDGHHGGGPEDADKVETVNGAPGWVTTTFCARDLR